MLDIEQKIYDSLKKRGDERITFKEFAFGLGMIPQRLEECLQKMQRKGVLEKTRPKLKERIKLK